MRPGSAARDLDIVRPEHPRHLYTFLHHLLLSMDNRTHFTLGYVRAS